MKSAGLSDLKKELQLLNAKELSELCIKLAKYKKDNKEYLSYLLYESHDCSVFVKEIKEEIDINFESIKTFSNLYYVKKGLRKVLRQISKYSKYINDKGISAELYIYFCLKLKESGIPFTRNQVLVNLYQQQLKKINTLLSGVHEDLRHDYASDLERIGI